MINRIRVGVLLFKNDKILLIKHVNPKDGYTWWVPPGGGVQDNETIFDCAKREVFEESGLKVDIEKPIYIRQFIFNEFQQNNIDIYLLAKYLEGNETTDNMHGKGDDDKFIKELKYFSKEEIQKINVFPKVLQSKMWDDRSNGFPSLQFLGVEHDKQ